MTDPVVRYESFRGTWISWEDLFKKAANFSTQVGPERLISISHSADKSDGIVTVWYWSEV